MVDTIRTFVSIELSKESRQYAVRLQESLQRKVPAGLRWVSPDRAHLTLAFLGNVSAGRIRPLKSALIRAAGGSGPLMLKMGGAGRFPERGRPRVLWVGIEDETGALRDLQKAVAEACGPFAEKGKEGRFHAHITLARVRDARKAAGMDGAIADAGQETGPRFTVEEVWLTSSQLTSEGPIYEHLARIDLTKQNDSEE
ncbi:MAG: RNA 2',3'-cyclic phosphodiesterase [Planctomycetia bacterium]|nr:RNA 2',3'-cyclic phosphodiesterase [Planctomycetia bacterium]